MVLPGHLAGGYLAARAVLDLAPAAASLSPTQTAILIVIGTIFGDSPDIDLLFYYFNQKSSRPDMDENGHRHYVTHTPAFWLALSLAIAAAGYIAGSIFVQFIGWMVLAGSWTHLLLDSIEFGVRWLWPLTSRRFSLMKGSPDPEIDAPKGSLSYYRIYLLKTSFRNVTFYAELLVTALALWIAFR